MKVCSVVGCENKHVAKNYCQKHYDAFKEYGDPLVCKKRVRIKTECVVGQCKNISLTKDLCRKHYRKWCLYGDPFAGVQRFSHKQNTKEYFEAFTVRQQEPQ